MHWHCEGAYDSANLKGLMQQQRFMLHAIRIVDQPPASTQHKEDKGKADELEYFAKHGSWWNLTSC